MHVPVLTLTLFFFKKYCNHLGILQNICILNYRTGHLMKEKKHIFKSLAEKLMNDTTKSNVENLVENLTNSKQHSNYKIDQISYFWKNIIPKEIENNIIKKTFFAIRKDNKITRQLKLIRITAAAALLMFFLGASSLIYSMNRAKHTTLKEFRTEANNVKEFILDDGTKVWLNSESILLAPQPFIGTKREVFLTGQAYFEVTKNKKKPFIVNSQNLKTKVLGTHFSVQSYPNDITNRAILYEGSIEVESKIGKRKRLLLKEGFRANLNLSNGFFSSENCQKQPRATWRNGLLNFYNEDLESICKKLERKFNITITVLSDELSELKFTANFENESLTEILTLLQCAHDFEYEYHKKMIAIKTK